MNNSTGVAVSTPLFVTHLTDEELASILGVVMGSIRNSRSKNKLPKSERLPVQRTSYSGRRVHATKNFTPVDDVRAWLEADGREEALAALDKVLASKLASCSEQGE